MSELAGVLLSLRLLLLPTRVVLERLIGRRRTVRNA